MDQIVFPLALLLGFATILPAAGLYMILSRRFRQERDWHREVLAELESGSATAMLTIDAHCKILTSNAGAGKLFEYPRHARD